jgi:hypothetical protein
MFSPRDAGLERGWPGRIEGDHVIQLAAQTLQSFFTGGGTAREHAGFRLDEVVLRAPVLHPPAVRIFDADGDFRFANPTAIVGPDDTVRLPEGADEIVPVLRIAAVIGAEGAIAGFTLMNDWLAPALPGTKAHDFAISLGPVVVTREETDGGAGWDARLERAARNTTLLPGDVLAGPGVAQPPAGEGAAVELRAAPFGSLRNSVAR